MADSDKSGFPVFDRKDFSSWKIRLDEILAERELLDHVGKEPTHADFLDADWKKNDVKARNIIVKCLSNAHIENVRQELSAYGMLTSLCTVFERKGVAQERYLWMKQLALKFSDKEPMERQLAPFDAIIPDLRAAGAQMRETEINTHLLMTLPKSYEGVRTALEALDPYDLTVAKVKARLFGEEIKRFETGDVDAESAEGGYSRAAFLERRKKFIGKCWRCKQAGHKAHECPRSEEDFDRERHSERCSEKKVFQLNRGEHSFDREESKRGRFVFCREREM